MDMDGDRWKCMDMSGYGRICMDMSEKYIDMGGYAAFVWPAYALAVVGLGVLFILTTRSVKMQQAELDRLRLPRSGPKSGSSGQAGGTAGSGT